LRKRGAENVGTRVLIDDELRLFWRRVVLPPVSRRVGLALRLALLTGARASEVAGLGRTELEHAPGMAVWTIPAARSKNGHAHYVPLSGFACETIAAARELIADDDAFVFPSPQSSDHPITGHALAVAMRRMARKIDGPGSKSWKANPPSPHDLRRTMATRLAGLGVPQEDIAAILNHKRSDVTGRHYDLYDRAKEKRIALARWADTLRDLVDPRAAVATATENLVGR